MLQNAGKRLLVALGCLLSLSACRKDPPPKIDIGTGDGFGGANAVLKNGTREYWPPSKLKNAWITNQEDMAAFAAWCYDIDVETARAALENLRANTEEPPYEVTP